MNKAEKMAKCTEFFNSLVSLLSETYTEMGSCNKDFSRYLVPKGTEHLVTYYGKPSQSFRISDHWNWYSSINKCCQPKMIQCFSHDMPWPRMRNKFSEEATKPRFGIQVSFYGKDGLYHCVYGERYDRKTKEWSWIETNPEDCLSLIR